MWRAFFALRAAPRSLAAAGAAVGLALGATGVASAAAKPMYPIADAYVNWSTALRATSGTTTSLRSENDPLRIAFLKFRAARRDGRRAQAAGLPDRPLWHHASHLPYRRYGELDRNRPELSQPPGSPDRYGRFACRRRSRMGRERGPGFSAQIVGHPRVCRRTRRFLHISLGSRENANAPRLIVTTSDATPTPSPTRRLFPDFDADTDADAAPDSTPTPSPTPPELVRLSAA